MSDPFAPPPSQSTPAPPSSSPPPMYPPMPAAPPGQAPPYQPEPGQSTNGFAIASLVLGIIGVGVLAVIFGIIALVQINRRGQKGRGLAVAGLVLSGIWTVAIGVGVVVALMSEADRDSTGEIIEEGTVSTTSMQVGDCVNDLEEAAEIASLPAVPCAEPHDGEVFGLFDLPRGDFPDEESLDEQAGRGCSDLLRLYSAPAFDDPSVGLFFLYPTESAWPDDREIVCVAVSLDGPATGSYADR